MDRAGLYRTKHRKKTPSKASKKEPISEIELARLTLYGRAFELKNRLLGLTYPDAVKRSRSKGNFIDEISHGGGSGQPNYRMELFLFNHPRFLTDDLFNRENIKRIGGKILEDYFIDSTGASLLANEPILRLMLSYFNNIRDNFYQKVIEKFRALRSQSRIRKLITSKTYLYIIADNYGAITYNSDPTFNYNDLTDHYLAEPKS